MPKIKVFLWQLYQKALPVRGTLLRRGMAINPVCPLCLEDIETNGHIFKDCHSTIKIWQSAIQHGWLLAYTEPKNNFDIYQWLVKIKNHKQPKVLQQTAFLLWSIWKHMNAIVFRNDIFKLFTCLIEQKRHTPNGESELPYRLMM